MLFKWLRNGLLILVAFGASILLVNHLNGKKILLPEFVDHVLSYFNELVLIDAEPIKSNLKSIQLPPNNKFLPIETNEILAPRIVCKDHSIGELQAKKKSNIYTWKDNKGVTHFSDKKPEDNQAKQLELAGEQVFDFFSLNIVGANIPFEFKEKLSRSINKMFAVYGRLIDKNNLKKVSVNLKFIASKKGFERYRAKHAPSVKTTLGFYDNGTNEAVIFYGDPKRAFRTAIHESAHAINRGVIGSTNKWLNEGLAEYLETISTNLSSAEISPNPDWFNKGKLRNKPMPLPQLLNASHSDWNSDARSQFYATSWAFVYFLMDEVTRREELANIIKLEQQNMCDQLTTHQALDALGTNIKTLQKQFYKWLNNADIFPHVI